MQFSVDTSALIKMMRPDESLARKRIKSYKTWYVSHHTHNFYLKTHHLKVVDLPSLASSMEKDLEKTL